jgi:hypothetical protein
MGARSRLSAGTAMIFASIAAYPGAATAKHTPGLSVCPA